MSTQISIQLSDKLFENAKTFAQEHGYSNIQEFIRELIREKVFENENIGGIYTYKASEDSLKKNWAVAEEEKAWKHLQKKK